MKRSRSSEDCRQAARADTVNSDCSTDAPAAVSSSAASDWEAGAAIASPLSPAAEPWTNNEHADYLYALERRTTRKIQKLMHLKNYDMRPSDFLVQERAIKWELEGAERQPALVLSTNLKCTVAETRLPVADEDDRGSVIDSGFCDAQVPQLAAGRPCANRTSQCEDEDDVHTSLGGITADIGCTLGTARAGWKKMSSEGRPTRRPLSYQALDITQGSASASAAPSCRQLQCTVTVPQWQAKKLYLPWREWTEASCKADGSLVSSDEGGCSGSGSGVTYEESSLSEGDDSLPVMLSPSRCPGFVDAPGGMSAREGTGGMEEGRGAALRSSGKHSVPVLHVSACCA